MDNILDTAISVSELSTVSKNDGGISGESNHEEQCFESDAHIITAATKKLSILITGHCGYIGSALVQFLKALPYIKRIVGYDIVEGDDILDEIKLTRIMRSHKIDFVIHLAALSSVSACADDPLLAIEINAKGTQSVLNAMKISGCENIIYASTSSVYGDSKYSPYREDQCLYPCSPYGISKLLGEYVIVNHYDMKANPGNYLLFRMFNVVGSSGFPDIDMGANPGYDRLFAALQSGDITIYGKDYDTTDGTCERDYVSLRDICDAYIKGIETIAFRSTNPSNETIGISPCGLVADVFRERRIIAEYIDRLRIGDTLNVGDIMVENISFNEFSKISQCRESISCVGDIRLTLNICSGTPISVKSVIDKWNNISSIIAGDRCKYHIYNNLPFVTYKYGDRREGDPSKVFGSNNRAQKLIGWTPKRKINDVIFDLSIDKKF
jgi:UDP-glucose 4-epimerase